MKSGKDIISLYHTIKSEDHGEEKDPTLYLLKKQTKPYHLDYCFVITFHLTLAVWMIGCCRFLLSAHNFANVGHSYLCG